MKTPWLLIIFAFLMTSTSFASFREADRAISLYNESLKKWQVRYANAPDDTIRAELIKTRPNARRTTQYILKSIGTKLNEPEALRSISWIYENDSAYLMQAEGMESGKAIRSALNRSHFNRPGAGQLCLTISNNFSTQDLKFLDKVAKHSTSKPDQGFAALAVSIALAQLGDDPELLQKRLANLRKAIKLIPEGSELNGAKTTDIIADHLYYIQNLAKGKTAPQFIGRNIAGTPISGPVAGKVTVIVFWSDEIGAEKSWMDILRNIQSTCTKTGAKMIGVYNGDAAALRKQMANRDVTWPNIFDNDFKVTQKYRVRNTPVVYLLDKSGKVQTVGEPNSLITLSIQALTSASE